ncbi:hypothetical protein LTR93_011252 [Exophiala xenobiotica]|nr:hypothetical protein LTR93_011252 [Exophiala xenobiotica]
MTNLAAVIPAPKASLEVQHVEAYKPGPHELLVKNQVIAFNPIEAKIARMALLPIQYPAILGWSFGGTVDAVGVGVTSFEVGDRVVVHRRNEAADMRAGAYQRYVIATEDKTSKVPPEVEITVAASVIANLTTVVGLFSVRVGLDTPTLGEPVPAKGKKVLIYGGSSSFGSLAVQYVAQAGYTVVTTTSPKHKAFVAQLGAKHVVDHTQVQDAMVQELVAHGPYEVVADSVSLPHTVQINAAVLAAQGGGKVYATVPAFRAEDLPEGVTRVFASWPEVLAEEDDAGLNSWLYSTYLPRGLLKGNIIPLPIEKVTGGLREGVKTARDKLHAGVSGVKLVADPWE